MKKFIAISIFMFCNCVLFAQGNPTQIANIFPASPEAATLGRFGDVPVNSSIGMAGFSIPVFDIEIDDFNLPITINYQHNGLMVDQIPGHLGMGWNLNAGGMVTRQVRGKPDDHGAGYVGLFMTGREYVVPYLNNQLPPITKDQLKENVASGIWDSQPDKFIVSVGDLNATFYLDENRLPIIKPYKPYKVVPNFVNDIIVGFEVTDDKGVKYIFQDSEETKRLPPLVDGEHPLSPVLDWYSSSWKLTQIITTNNEVINFSYDDVFNYQKTLSQNFKQKLGGGCSNFYPFSNAERFYHIHSKILNEITFPSGKLVFNNTIINYTTGHLQHYNKYKTSLNSIELINNINEITSSFDLQYDDTNKTRKLLTQVKLNNDITNTYDFEYEGIPLDDIDLAKQDFWGYYNNNNSGYLINYTQQHNLYVNRQPDFSNSVLGSLKKIIYPTKGYTEIEYEANTVDPEGNEVPYECSTVDMNTNELLSVDLTFNDHQNGIHEDNQTLIITIEEPYLYVDLQLLVEKTAIDGQVQGTGAAEILKIGTITNPCEDEDCSGEGSPCQGASIALSSGIFSYEPDEERYFRRVKLAPGDYQINVSVSNLWGAPPGVPGNFHMGDHVRATAQIYYFVDDGSPPPLFVEVGGTRVSKIKSCPDANPANCIMNEYIYEDNNGLSLGQLFRKRNVTKYRSYFTSNTENLQCSSSFLNHSSGSYVPLAFFMGSHVYYNNVKEKQITASGELLGYTQKEFTFFTIGSSSFPFTPMDHKEYRLGKLRTEKIYNDQEELLNYTTYNHQFTGTLNGIDETVYALNFGIKSLTLLQILDTVLETYEYEENAPAFANANDIELITGTTNEQWRNGNLIETVTANSYTNPQSHLKSQEITGSDLLQSKIEYLYPYDLGAGTYNDLIALNRIKTPVQIKKYFDSNLTSNVKTEYSFSNNGETLEPKKVKSSKGVSNLEERLVYHNYDTYGNPTEVSQTGGLITTYIWGYKGQYPVAKVENATYTASIATGVNMAIIDGSNPSVQQVQDEINKIRLDLPNALVTTYTYKPLIGVSTITDPGGHLTTYHYDDFNRLEYVKDKDGNVLSENQYNYKN